MMAESRDVAKENTGRFGPHNKPRGGSVKGRKIRQPSGSLRDMRRVAEGRVGPDATPGQKALQRLLEEHPEKFLTRLFTLEQLLLAR